MSAPLLDALKAVAKWRGIYDGGPIGRYEAAADDFYRETGRMAPGKSESTEYVRGEEYRKETQALWTAFLDRRNAAVDSTIRAALEPYACKRCNARGRIDTDEEDDIRCPACAGTGWIVPTTP